VYNEIMPKRKRRPTIQQLQDMTGMLKVERWNYCQAIARLLYLSTKDNDALRQQLAELADN